MSSSKAQKCDDSCSARLTGAWPRCRPEPRRKIYRLRKQRAAPLRQGTKEHFETPNGRIYVQATQVYLQLFYCSRVSVGFVGPTYYCNYIYSRVRHTNVFNGPLPPFLSFQQLTKNMFNIIFLPMRGFELHTSGIRRDCSAN